MKVLVTGASGFVGTTLCAELIAHGHEVRAAVRRPGSGPAGAREILIDDISETTSWAEALAGQETVVHLAARVHVMTETASDPLTEFRRVNTAGTLALAKAAQEADVQKFVFLSSIKANGERTTTDPFTVRSQPTPEDAYGISKLEAEIGLSNLAVSGGTEFTSIRTPLVYGPGVGGNFLRILKLVDRGLPLPLAGVTNRRTMTSVWNLVDLIENRLKARESAFELVLAGDSQSLSTAELIRSIATGMARPARLFWVPVWLMARAARILRKGPEADRLLGSLEVEVGSTSPDFSWSAPIAASDGVARTAREWKAATRR